MSLPSRNSIKYHEDILSLQSMIPPKRSDIFHPNWRMLRGLDASRSFFKEVSPRETPPFPPCLLSSEAIFLYNLWSDLLPACRNPRRVGTSSARHRRRWSCLPCSSCSPPLIPRHMTRRANMMIQTYLTRKHFCSVFILDVRIHLSG